MTDPGIIILAMTGISIFFGVVLEISIRVSDTNKIKHYLTERACRVLRIQRDYSAIDSHPLANHREAYYRVKYLDSFDRIQEGICRRSGGGVFWKTGGMVQHQVDISKDSHKDEASRYFDEDSISVLQGENQDIHQRIQDIKRMHRFQKEKLESQIKQLKAELEHLRN